jgi:tetratricopeptide (TPR) repeat protein
MADAQAAMPLALADGRVLLTIENRDLGKAVVERVAVDWPGVSALPEAGRPNGLRARRGRLRAASLLVDSAHLGKLAETTALPEGLNRIDLAFEKGRLMVSGSVTAAGRDADFKARVRLTAGGGRRIRISIEDVRLQGAPPLPLSAIGTAVLTAFSSHMGGQSDAQPAEALELDVLGPALDELLVAAGWRLPDSAGVRFSSAVVSVRGLELSWADERAQATTVPQPIAERTSQGYEAPLVALRRSLDDAPPGPERAVVAQKLAAAYERANDERGAVDALKVCIDNAGPGPLVGNAWRRLVELYARSGDPHAAARALIASADDARTGASEAERAAALVAAAEILRKRLALPGDAGMLLERAIALDGASIEAIEALEALSTETGNFERLAEMLERKLQVAARGPVEQQEILSRLVRLYDGPVPRPERVGLLRDRMAMIDLETTPMIPIPPPETRVGVPPVPESRGGAAAPPVAPAVATAQAAAHAAAGKTAEAGGDLERAEQAYWRAASIEAEPALRANYLVAHARVLLARGDVETARGQLEAARDRAPGHLGASALLADVSYRTQDWSRARELYTMLEGAPHATEVVSREVLVHRRAALADRQGDTAEAEALYRELAILNPQHLGARKALAELARGRGDLPGAIHRLEEVLRLMPPDAGSDLLDVRQRLGALHAEMGEWQPARHYLELVLGQDPGRVPALELLLESYDRLAMPAEAAKVCARLARLYFEPSRRAAALYRQAEILREQLSNPAAALDAYLRSSDVDPRFVPARLRLVDHFWNIGDIDVVTELASDLNVVPLSADNEPDLVARLAIATTTLRGGAAQRFPFTPALAQAAVRAIVEAAGYQEQESRPLETLDPILTRARIWAGTEGEAMLYKILTDMVREDPGQPGAATALGRLAETGKRLALARAAYGLAAFVIPDCPAARHIAVLASPGHVQPETVAIGGPVDHPDIRVPARRALAGLATALLGYATDQTAPKPTEGSGLPPSRATELRRIADLIASPPFIVVRDQSGATAGDERRRLRVIPTQPAGLLIGASTATLSESSWSFVAGRALETLRSGLRTAGLAGAEGLARLLEGARATLADAPVDEPQAKAVADWLRTPDAVLSLGSAENRAAIRADVEAALAALPDWQTFTRGAMHTRNRIGLLACTNPADALVVLKADERGVPVGRDTNTPEGRQAFLRGPVAGALIEFMLSPAWEEAFAPDPEEQA